MFNYQTLKYKQDRKSIKNVCTKRIILIAIFFIQTFVLNFQLYAETYGAESNPTGNPIGGGVGYSDIKTSVQADYVVYTKAQLLSALSSATSGEIIYIDDDSEIDLTDEKNINVPGGVIIASGRGRDGSKGGLIYTAEFDSDVLPLFLAGGESVRFTGLRLQGPDSEVGDHNYTDYFLARGIQSGYPFLKVDNCELSGWGHATIYLDAGSTDAHIHHNYIHHNRRSGYGYGVSHGYCDADNPISSLIEANLFDYNRHSIAGAGNAYVSYEACYNIILEHANSHGFDMHGAADFEKSFLVANWRFDEGQGDTAYDSSNIYYYPASHGTLMNMDIENCWVDGDNAKINTALQFDGTNDYIDCGNNESLQIDGNLTLEFWIKPVNLGAYRENPLDKNYGGEFALTLEDNPDAGKLSYYHGTSRTTSDEYWGWAAFDSGTIVNNAWQHIVITRDASTRTMKSYYNGMPKKTTVYPDDPLKLPSKSSYNVLIGDGYAHNFNGIIDEVRIYNRVLDADTVKVHYESPDVAGDTILIHHNTFRMTDQSAVVIRGRPKNVCEVHHNWFYDTNPDHAVRQLNTFGNIDIHTNYYGTNPPAGTVLPVSHAKANPGFGSLPLEVSFDGADSYKSGGTIVAYAWDYGDETGDEGVNVSNIFNYAGIYNASLTVTDDIGIPMSDIAAVTVYPESQDYILSFWVKDSYRGSLTNRYFIQALIDENIVWEQDVAGDDGWQHVIVDISDEVESQDSVTLSFKVYTPNGVSWEEIVDFFVYWDDVILFGGHVVGGGFEAPWWQYSENGSLWSGGYQSGEVRSGNSSYRIYHPYKKNSVAGSWGEVSQAVSINSPDVRGQWDMDDGTGSMSRDNSLYHNHGVINEASWTVGVAGKALMFDGENDWINVPHDSSLNITDEITVEACIKFSDLTDGGIIGKYDNWGEYCYCLWYENGSLWFEVGSGNIFETKVSYNGINDTEVWYHIAGVYDGTNVRLYVNGVEADSALENRTLGTGAGSLTIGNVRYDGVKAHFFNETNEYFHGKIDEVCLYSKALSPSEVYQNYQRLIPRGVWHFDEGEGTIAEDSSGKSNNGTLSVGMSPYNDCWVDGKIGKALKFDGVDDYVDCGNDASLNITDEITIEMWINPANWSTIESLLSNNLYKIYHRGDWAGDKIYFLFRIEEYDWSGDSAWAYWAGVKTSTKLETGEWYHVVGVKSGNTISIYLNGEMERSLDCLAGYTIDASQISNLNIGKNPFNGTIDEVQIYNWALSADEIYQHYFAGTE